MTSFSTLVNFISTLVGSSQGIAIVENLMEHLAKACNSDPLEYRLKNLASGGNGQAHQIRSIINHVRSSSDFDERQRQVSSPTLELIRD